MPESMHPIVAAQKRLAEDKTRIAANLAGVEKKIAILSGKGGVGKTFVSIGLSYALSARGYHTGLLDADIDCPNVPLALGIMQTLTTREQKIVPVEHQGVVIASMALFPTTPDERDHPRIWRGPLISKGIMDFLEKTDWAHLDYLLIDMPPGTSDAALTLMQVTNLDGILLVGTSSPASILDAKKAFLMAKQMNQPVLGFIENMASNVFGSGEIEKLARQMNAPFLGSVPLSPAVRESIAQKKTPLENNPELENAFAQILENMGVD